MVDKTEKRMYREIVDYRALESKVLVVAVAQEPIDEWCVYIGAVAGKNHADEYLGVKEYGNKIMHDLARILFPQFEDKYRWRD